MSVFHRLRGVTHLSAAADDAKGRCPQPSRLRRDSGGLLGVILSEVKNLCNWMYCEPEILRLAPQNDILRGGRVGTRGVPRLLLVFVTNGEIKQRRVNNTRRALKSVYGSRFTVKASNHESRTDNCKLGTANCLRLRYDLLNRFGGLSWFGNWNSRTTLVREI